MTYKERENCLIAFIIFIMLTIMSKNILNGILVAISLILLMTATIVGTSILSVDAAITNATPEVNETAQSLVNKTGEALQQINPFK
jgi:hypothetical protein